jgi:hypothetical protein
MKKGTTRRAEEYIEAPAEVIYDLVADITRMGEWSPECVDAEWVDGNTAPVVGARFRGRNRHGLARWSNKPRVVAAERGREFAFIATDPFGHDTTRWTYTFEPNTTGTRVCESFELLRDLPLYLRLSDRWMMRVKDRPADLEVNMRSTLAALKIAAEASTTGDA